MFKKSIILYLLLLSSKAFPQTTQSDFSFSAPDSIAKLKSLKLWATQYYIPQFKSTGRVPFISEDGKPLGLYADTCTFCKAAMEGTACITDSMGNITVINYARTGEKVLVDCYMGGKLFKSKSMAERLGKVLWKVSSGFGDGVKNYKLIPYRTIAVDKTLIPYGTVIYIPGVRGKTIQLPDGTKVIHDGYFFAGDTGGAIKDNHIDVFTGICVENPFPKVVTSNKKDMFEAYLVNDQTIIKSLTSTSLK